MNISEEIIQFAQAKKNPPKSVTHILNLSILDWVGVSSAGINEKVSRIVRDCFLTEDGRPEAYVLGTDKKTSSRTAALINGTISHALDYDDTHFASLGHPSVVVMPAAMAISDRIGSDTGPFKEAILCGMEVAIRIGMWLGRAHYRKGFHITGTAGTFGATVASALILELNDTQFQMALGLAASRASGIKNQFGTMGKPFHAGAAASNGVEVALLASQGFEATWEPFDGIQGFASTHASENNINSFQDLGRDFLFEDISHKFHACCHGLHASMEALASIRDREALIPDDVQEISIVVHPQYLNVCNIMSPETGLEVKFSYRFTAAMVIHGLDTARLENFSSSICLKSDLIKMSNKVIVKTNESLSETAAIVTLKTCDNQIFTDDYDLTKLIDPVERETKVRSKSVSLLGKENSNRLWNSIIDEKEYSGKSVSELLFEY
jgi:2-methylcitrate dehydratase PrpD